MLKLLEEFIDNDHMIPIDLDWDNNEGVYKAKDYLFDHLPSFDLVFNIDIRETGHWVQYDYMEPPEWIRADLKKDITNIKAFEKEGGIYTDIDEDMLIPYIEDLIKI